MLFRSYLNKLSPSSSLSPKIKRNRNCSLSSSSCSSPVRSDCSEDSSSSSSTSSGLFFHESSSNDFIDISFSSNQRDDIGIVKTETTFLKNINNTPKLSPSSSRKRSHRSSITSSSSSLPSIPESDQIDHIPNDIQKVTLITMIDNLSSNFSSDLNSIGERLHQIITSNMDFTCMNNGSKILKQSYKQLSNEIYQLSESSQDPLVNQRYSSLTIMISERDVCLAHVGDSRSIIYGLEGSLLQLTKDHIDLKSGNVTRALGDKDVSPDTMYFQIQNESRLNQTQQQPTQNKQNDSPLKKLVSKLLKNKNTNNGDSQPSSKTPYLVIGNSAVWKSTTNKDMTSSIKTNILNKNFSLDENVTHLIDFANSDQQKIILIQWKN